MNTTRKIGDIIQFGEFEWCIINIHEGTALLLSRYVIQKKPYHIRDEAVTWEKCTLRQFLNGFFYKSFEIEERNLIVEKKIRNDNNQQYGTPGGNETSDYIFLLNADEMDKYCNDYKLRKGLDLNKKAAMWWLRSPGGYAYCAINVNTVGRVYLPGTRVNSTTLGIRPAMYINICNKINWSQK